MKATYIVVYIQVIDAQFLQYPWKKIPLTVTAVQHIPTLSSLWRKWLHQYHSAAWFNRFARSQTHWVSKFTLLMTSWVS